MQTGGQTLHKTFLSGSSGSTHQRALICALIGESGRLDVVEARELFFEIGVALGFNARLVGTFAISGVDLVHVFHPAYDFAYEREALAVEARVVAEVDE